MKPIIVILALLIFANLQAQEENIPPNIVFIYADDWGYGDLSLHGHPVITTPNLDQLAAEGTEFLQFNVSNPVCSPSRTAILTGHFPARHHVHQHFSDHNSNMSRNMPDWLDPSEYMLPRFLKESGYRTAHFGKWHLTSARIDDPPLTVDYGYDEVRIWHGAGPKVEGPRGVSTGTCVDYSIDFIDRNRDAPFFINLWIHESHAAIDPPQDAIDEYAHVEEPYRSYYACISYADRELGRLFRFLKDEQLDSNTLVIFSSDNGPENPSSNPDALTYYSRGETAGLIGQKRSLFEGGVGLPFIVHWPGTVPAGKVNNTTHIAAVDVLPTFCGIAGVELPEDYESDGEDLSPSIAGGTQQRNKPVFWDWRGPGNGANWPRHAVRSGDWKLLCNESGAEKRLYNIQASRVEEFDSAAYYPELADSLFRLISNWKLSLPASIPMDGIRFFTNRAGDQVIIDFSGHDSDLDNVLNPEFRLHKSDIEINIDSISTENKRILLHISSDKPEQPDDELRISFHSGKIMTTDGASLLFFSGEPVINKIQTGPELFSTEFNVLDGSSNFRLPDASVSVGSVKATTNLNGEAYFLLPQGNYSYNASKQYYRSITDTLALNSDTLVRVFLYPTLASVKFRITDASGPLSNANVRISDNQQQTNAVGISIFENLAIAELFQYSVSKSGYEEVSDTLLLERDTTLQVVLNLSTGLPGENWNEFRIYPNPVHSILHIESGDRIINRVEICDLKGSVLGSVEESGRYIEIDISGIPEGNYILNISSEGRETASVGFVKSG